MAGQVLELIPRTVFDFTFVGASANQQRFVVMGVPTSAYSTGTMMLRVHAVDIASSGSSISFALTLDASMPGDPAHSFINSQAISGSTVTADDSTTEGELVTSAISADMGYKVAVAVTGTVGAGGGSCMVEASVVLVLKDNS